VILPIFSRLLLSIAYILNYGGTASSNKAPTILW
jgi:hypothetical protein